MKKYILFIIVIILILILLFFIMKAVKESYTPIESEGTYKKLFTVTNLDDLRKYFIIDNPLEDGDDPTDGLVDYSYAMPKNENGLIIPNINGDISWSEIPTSGNINELVSNYDNGIKINLSKNLVTKGLYPNVFKDSCFLKNKVGTVRLSSRKLFKGGLFVFDVEHIPVGCGIWPAIWLNGFVGLPDQYHSKEGSPEFLKGIEKLKKSTKTCGSVDNTLDPYQSLDKFMSKYTGKNVYQAQWPVGGEFDIVEQTQFSPTNLMSIHGGPNCEVKAEYKMDNSEYLYPYISDFHKNMEFRSTCGETMDRNAGYDHYSGCRTDGDRVQINCNVQSARSCPQEAGLNSGNTQIVGPYGSFGPPFNETGGGVYVLQWIPNKKVFMWFYPRTDFSKEELSKDGMPLSENPKPEIWQPSVKDKKVLLMSYRLDNHNALKSGCDFNYQALIINITVGGGWGGNTVPPYCKYDYYNCNIPKNTSGGSPGYTGGTGSSGYTGGTGSSGYTGDSSGYTSGSSNCDIKENYQSYNIKLREINTEYKNDCGYNANGNIPYYNFVEKCYNAKPNETDKNGVGINGCYDGAYNKDARGINAKPDFFTEAYFKIRSISVFQRKEGNKETDDSNVW
jgi:hypothetical protein